MSEIRQFEITITMGLVGCRKSFVIEVDAEDVPEDPYNDPEFNEFMLEQMWLSGTVEWNYREVGHE